MGQVLFIFTYFLLYIMYKTNHKGVGIDFMQSNSSRNVQETLVITNKMAAELLLMA